MLHKSLRTTLILSALLALLVVALPVVAQDEARDFNYRVENFTLDTSAMQVRVTRRETLTMQDQALVFNGTLRCMDSGGCLEAGADGSPVQVTMELNLRPIQYEADDPAVFALAGGSMGRLVGEEQGRGFWGPVVALANCVDEACTAFDVELLACGVLRPAASERRMGIVLTGQLSLAAEEGWRDKPGEYTATWEDTVGTGYFTLDEVANPVCSQMRAMYEEQTGREFDLEAEDSAEALSEAMFGPAVWDSDSESTTATSPILNAVSVRRAGDDLVLQVDGYWVNRCPVETQMQHEGQVADDTAVVRVFRELPPDTVCQPGIETFERSLAMDYETLEAAGIRFLEVNGQIIAILIGSAT